MALKILPEHITRRLLQGEEDMITPEVAATQAIQDSTPCPRCGGHFHKMLDPNRAFSADRALPRSFLQCVDCGYTYDPHTEIVIATGNPAKVKDPFKINARED